MRRTLSLSLAAGVAGAAIAAAALAPVGGAVPFGADLNRPANNTIGCETAGIIASPFVPGQLILTPSGQTSCTWTANGRLGDFAETLAVPQSGTVTQIQVRVGPTTGPMRVVAYSALAKFPIQLNVPPACCQIRGASQVFTPAPNGITTVNVNIPVITERVPPPGGDIIRADSLALSVLSPGVPVPAHNTGNFDALQGAPIGGVYTPAVNVGQELLSPAGLVGFQPLLRAELTAAGAGGSGSGGSGGSGGASGAGGSGSSSVTCNGRKATVVGTPRNDTLRGTRGANVFAGLGGNDRIIGLGGNDIACGGPGNDILIGGAGSDILRGGSGRDVLNGGKQNDRLFGEGGIDRLLGGRGTDLLVGGRGNDRLDGGPGVNDRNIGGAGKDACRRGAVRSC